MAQKEISTLKKQFKSHLLSSKYIFKNGKEANFIGGVFLTNVEHEVSELQNEIELGHPHIYVDLNALEVDTKYVDPMEALKAKHFAEFEALQKKATDGSMDMGTSVQGKNVVTSSANVANAAADASAGSTGAAAKIIETASKPAAGIKIGSINLPPKA